MTPGDPPPRFDAYRRPADGVPRLPDGTSGSSDGAFRPSDGTYRQGESASRFPDGAFWPGESASWDSAAGSATRDGSSGSGDGAARSADGHDWLDSEAGPIVRAFTVTGGRAHPPVGAFDLMAFVVRNSGHERGLFLQPEHQAILDRADRPVSVAELASFVDLAVGVVRVLLGDLLQQGLISMYEPPSGAHRPGEDVLKAVVNGLRSL